ncbi:hypothetical protein [Halovenus salina]|uniref:AI-2E family transporter n=1 Tax=Halovenus salina TaxID=1510225 RepID=A0ABD5W693_9EURY
MRQPQSPRKIKTREYRERGTVRGLAVTTLPLLLLVAFMAAPAVMTGAVVGILGLKIAELLYPHATAVVTERRSAEQLTASSQVADGLVR